VTIRQFSNVKSPDYDGASGNLAVALGDLTQFSGEFLDNFANECHDYDNNGNTGLEDVIIFGTPFTGAASCAPTPRKAQAALFWSAAWLSTSRRGGRFQLSGVEA
jgi:hypothetical protein